MVGAVRTGRPGRHGNPVLVIPMDTPGISCRKIENSGQNSEGSAWVELEDAKVPVEYLIGAENEGFPIVMENFNKERFHMAVGAVVEQISRDLRMMVRTSFTLPFLWRANFVVGRRRWE